MNRLIKSAVVMGSAALLAAGCAGSTAASGGVRVDGPREERPSGGGAVASAKGVEINSKAKLAFEDALRALETQKKAKAVDYPGLEKKFRAAADADPNLAEATYNLGVLAERQGKVREAISLYKEALDRKPSLRQAAENLAVISQNQGDEQGAVAIYEDILKKYPDDASSRARLAEVYRRRGDLDKAMELAKEALFRDPKTLQAYKTMLQVHFAQKQYSMARLVALRASKIDDSDPEVFYTLGLMYLAEKDPVRARLQFKKAVEARPDYLPAHQELARLAFEQEDYAGAEESLRRLLQANSKNPEALVNLGVAYKGMGQYDKALASYDDAQKLKPDLNAIYLNRGIILGLKNEPEKAIELFKLYVAREGEVKLGTHPVFDLIKEQEAVLQKRDDDKKAADEAKKMEDEMNKQAADAAAVEKAKKEEEFKKNQADAKGNAAKDALKGAPSEGGAAPAPAPPKKEEKKPEAPKPAAPAAAPAPAKKPPAGAPGDEPSDGL